MNLSTIHNHGLTKSTLKKPNIPEEIKAGWQRLVDLMARVLGVAASLILRVDLNQIEVFVSSETEGNPYRKGERKDLNKGFYSEAVVRQRAPLLIPNALKDPEWDHNPDIKLGMTFYLGYPVMWPDGQIFGTICVLDGKDNSRATQFRDLISEFRQVIERDLCLLIEANEPDELLAELKRHRDRLKEMVAERTGELEISRKMLEERLKFEDLISDLSLNFVDLPPEVVHVEIALALKRICVFFGADHCGLLEVNADLNKITSVALYDKEGMRGDPMKVVLSSRHPWAYHWLIEEKEPVTFSSLAALPPEASQDRADWEQEGIQSMIILPLSFGGQVTHLIGLWNNSCSREMPLSYIHRLKFLGEIFAKALLHKASEGALLRSEQRLVEAQGIAHLGS